MRTNHSGQNAAPETLAMTQTRVAIITPVYNGAPWLERTLACVQAQTYANLVHVVLDNCSSDDTPDVIAQFQNGKVALITARNPQVLNQTDNWSAAMAMTPPGIDYVLLLCADDLIRADAVEKLVARAQEDPETILVAAGDVVDDQARLPFGPDQIDGKDMIRAVLTHRHNHYAWQCFFARWRGEAETAPYFSNGVASLDTDKILSLMESGKVGLVREPLIYTRHHGGTVSAAMTQDRNPRFRLWRWEAQVKYARALFSPAEARRAIKGEQYFLLRYVIAWRLAGAHASADALCQRMAKDGFPVSLIDHLGAIIDYPFYKARQKALARAANQGFEAPVSEAAFVAYR